MIRPAREADIVALAALRFALWPDEPLDVRRAETEANLARTDSGLATFVAEDTENPTKKELHSYGDFPWEGLRPGQFRGYMFWIIDRLRFPACGSPVSDHTIPIVLRCCTRIGVLLVNYQNA